MKTKTLLLGLSYLSLPLSTIAQEDPSFGLDHNKVSDERIWDLFQPSVSVYEAKDLIQEISLDDYLSEKYGFKLKENGNINFMETAVEEVSEKNIVHIVSNPVLDNLVLTMNESVVGNVQINLLDVTGRFVQSIYSSFVEQGAALKVEKSLERLPKGLYHLETINAGKQSIQKVIKQ